MELKQCPCGKTPTALNLMGNGQGVKWAWASGNCCSEWWIEFRTGYESLESEKCMEYAIKSWNETVRG